MSRTQKQIVLDLLAERGERGMSAREAIYDLRITRLAAVIFDLRQEGYSIRSETKKGETARYFLEAGSRQHAKNVRHCGNCGHLYRRHVAGMKCMDYVKAEGILDLLPPEWCPCEQFVERRRNDG
jgi:ribosomal protein L32